MAFDELVEDVDRAAMEVLGGEVVTYAPLVGSPATPTGIFSENYILAKGGAEAGVETIGPAVFFRIEDLPVNPLNDKPTLTIRGVLYRVHERMPDGMGGIVLAVRRIT